MQIVKKLTLSVFFLFCDDVLFSCVTEHPASTEAAHCVAEAAAGRLWRQAAYGLFTVMKGWHSSVVGRAVRRFFDSHGDKIDCVPQKSSREYACQCANRGRQPCIFRNI